MSPYYCLFISLSLLEIIAIFCLFVYCLFPLLEYTLHEGRDFCLFRLLIYTLQVPGTVPVT